MHWFAIWRGLHPRATVISPPSLAPDPCREGEHRACFPAHAPIAVCVPQLERQQDPRRDKMGGMPFGQTPLLRNTWMSSDCIPTRASHPRSDVNVRKMFGDHAFLADAGSRQPVEIGESGCPVTPLSGAAVCLHAAPSKTQLCLLSYFSLSLSHSISLSLSLSLCLSLSLSHCLSLLSPLSSLTPTTHTFSFPSSLPAFLASPRLISPPLYLTSPQLPELPPPHL